MKTLLWLKANWRWLALFPSAFLGVALGWYSRDYLALKGVQEAEETARTALTEQAKQYEREVAETRQASQRYQDNLSALQASRAKIQTVVRTEYVKAPYIACPLPDSGLQIQRDAEAATLGLPAQP